MPLKVKILNGITAISIECVEVKTSAYADDLTCFLKDEQSAVNLFMLLEVFSNASGLCINVDKTEALWLGKWRFRRDTPFGVRWPMSPIKIVGVYFSYDSDTAYDMNLATPLKGLKTVLQCWTRRNLTIVGKAQIIKSLIIPKILYLLNLINIRQKDIKNVNSKIYSFLWKGHDRVSRDTMIGDIGQGGMGMLDICALQKAFKVNWVKQYLLPNFHPWKLILNHYLKTVGGTLILNATFI